MSSAYIKKRLRGVIRRQRNLLEHLLRTTPILRGSFSRVHTRCGKPNCWCAESHTGHHHARVTWSENGKLTTRKVPPEQVNRIVELTENYRQFRSQRRKLLALDGEIRDLLDRYEKTLINRARKPFDFLSTTGKMSAPTNLNRQKRHKPQKGNL